MKGNAARLSPETRARLQAQHEAVVGRAIASEAIALELMARTVEAATQRLVAEVSVALDRESARRATMLAVRRVGDSLRLDFEHATARARYHARVLSRAQVASELAEVLAYLNQERKTHYVMPPIGPNPRTVEQDEVAAHLAGASMAQRWSSLAMAALVGWWRRSEEPVSGLCRRLASVTDGADPALRSHAAVHALDALNDEHRLQWRQLAAGH